MPVIRCNLNHYLEQPGRGQEWLAEWTGLSQSYISKICNAHATPNVISAIKIAQALGLYVEDIWQFGAEHGE